MRTVEFKGKRYIFENLTRPDGQEKDTIEDVLNYNKIEFTKRKIETKDFLPDFTMAKFTLYEYSYFKQANHDKTYTYSIEYSFLFGGDDTQVGSMYYIASDKLTDDEARELEEANYIENFTNRDSEIKSVEI